MEASSVTDLLFKQLNYRGERQKIISSNIANIDTPDYKTKNLRFDNELKKSNDDYQLKLTTTNKMHFKTEFEDDKNDFEVYDVKGLKEQNDLNNVNLDTQMGEMSKNNIMFQAIQNSIKKDALWFKSMIDSSSKN